MAKNSRITKLPKIKRQFKPTYRVKDLPPFLQEAHHREPPPQDWLAARYGWDEDFKAFFYVNDIGCLEYMMPNEFVRLSDGFTYATWRVVSMLLLGNPNGLPDLEKHRAILESAPNFETGLTDEVLRIPAPPKPTPTVGDVRLDQSLHPVAYEYELAALEAEKKIKPRRIYSDPARVAQIKAEIRARKARKKR